MLQYAGIAQLVEHNLAKVGVASSSLVSRSSYLLASLKILYELGWVAEWLCSGLQSRLRRFDSGPSLHNSRTIARVAKLVDARDLKSLGGNTMPVRFRPRAPLIGNLFRIVTFYSILHLLGIHRPSGTLPLCQRKLVFAARIIYSGSIQQ